MSTLLIDADLRRGSLCPLLDVPDGLGLSDVLKGQSSIEDAVVPVQGGTFSLLSAGTPIREIGTLFQDRQFGMFITQLRQLYDLIIIDSPPVLPVPDALILGRWADGAILVRALRYQPVSSTRASPPSTGQRGGRRPGDCYQRPALLRLLLWTLHVQ